MRELPEAEYMKIRNYVLNMVYRAGQESILIPSSRELAAQFCVARATATKALNLLIEEKYLIPKKGVGTFSNSQKMTRGAPFRLVGVLIGGGKDLFHEYSSWVFPALVGLELTKHDCRIREIHLTGIDTPERIETEIRSQMLDGLLCIANTDAVCGVVEKLADEGMPVAGVFNKNKIRTCNIDLDAAGYDIGEIFIREGRKRIAGYFPTHPIISGALRKVCEENGLEYFPFHDSQELEQFLRNGGSPDAFYITAGFDSPLMDLMEDIGLDFREKCRLATYRPKVIDPRFCGYHYFPPETEIAAKISKDLIEMMDGSKLKTENILFRLQIQTINL